MSPGDTAGGTGTDTIPLSPPSGYKWSCSQVSVESTSTTATTCTVNINGNFICGTARGNQDSADGTPVPVNNGDTLNIVWSGASAGAQLTTTVVVDEVPS
jgi:hypothetical protein